MKDLTPFHMQCINLSEDINYLFHCDFFAPDFDPEGEEIHKEFSEQVLENYLWDEIYQAFYNHFTTDCKTEKSVYNAINLFFYYCFDENEVPNPYELAGYILYRIDIANSDENWKKYGDFIDSFINTILEKSGNINLMNDPYYRSWEDTRVLATQKYWLENN